MKLKHQASFFSLFLRSPIYYVCLIQITEQVDEKRGTVCTIRYDECLLINTYIKHYKIRIVIFIESFPLQITCMASVFF